MEQLTLDITREEYEKSKNRIKKELNTAANSFVIIGYELKRTRDNRGYILDGYSALEEFAKGEYGLSKSSMDRFIMINDKFSEGGYSDQIKEEYGKYGRSKLQEMLTMEDYDIELITPDMTVTQIRDLKKIEQTEAVEAKREAENNLPLMKMSNESEPAAGQHETVATSQYNPLEKILIALWKDRPTELLSGIRGGMITGSELAEELSPSGSKTFTSGTYMLFMYTENVGVKFRYYANGKANIETYTYDQIIEITNNFVTDELFREITSPKKEEKQVEAQPKQENTVQIPAEKKQTPPVEKPSSEAEETYKTLPGQMTFYDTQESEQAAEVQDAEYCEIQEVEEIEYTQIEIDNAIGYFETEYNRMAGMGIQNTKSRNYKMALDAIRKTYGL